jgi:hypothetical protein
MALLLFLIFGGLTVWGFFNPTALYWYLGGCAAFTVWLLVGVYGLRSRTIRNLDYESLTPEERALLRKYMLYFGSPISAQAYSSTFSLIQALSLLWFARLMWNHEWAWSLSIVAVFGAATFMAPFIHPGTFLRFHHTRGNLPDFLQERLALLQRVEEKVAVARAMK